MADANIDYDLKTYQWETLKALRYPGLAISELNSIAVAELTALGLVDGRRGITQKGRKVMLRGSPRLWDVAA